MTQKIGSESSISPYATPAEQTEDNAPKHTSLNRKFAPSTLSISQRPRPPTLEQQSNYNKPPPTSTDHHPELSATPLPAGSHELQQINKPQKQDNLRKKPIKREIDKNIKPISEEALPTYILGHIRIMQLIIESKNPQKMLDWYKETFPAIKNFIDIEGLTRNVLKTLENRPNLLKKIQPSAEELIKGLSNNIKIR